MQSQAVEHVHQLAQASVITAVETECDPRQIQEVSILAFFGCRPDDFDGRAGEDVGEAIVIERVLPADPPAASVVAQR